MNAGYMCEMSRDDYMKIISKLIELKDRVSPMYYEIYDYQDVMGEKIM